MTDKEIVQTLRKNINEIIEAYSKYAKEIEEYNELKKAFEILNKFSKQK